ncbi:MAG: tetratricopeptide repeat protein [Verrucomicrobiaceae bacterium]|nr:tetratricopeptide repeat protein [Verrucomicrobiaceae bacterium]
MPAALPSGDHDIFISYAHQGDTSSRESVAVFVKRLHDELEAEFSRRFDRPLSIFFDQEDIQDFDHWQVRCHRALRGSRFFIACLSRSYLRSDACRWEWEEWCRLEVEHGLVGQGAASLWFVRLEALDAPEDAELLRQWKGDLLQRFHIQCHEWRQDDPSAFLDASEREELSRLTQHVAQRLRLLTLDRTRSGNLPWPNANFVGRETELAALRKHLIESPSLVPAGLHGIGGMGKTALALAFAHHEADAFPGGCWLLRCEGRDNLTGVFRSLVHDLDLTDKLTDEEKQNEALAVKRVLALLRPRGPALFVLDNVDQPALLAPAQTAFLSAEPWARLLFTTRLAPSEFETVNAAIHPIDVDRLAEDQGIELVRRYQPGQTFAASSDAAAAREIVRLLDGLTLAIETAAVYLGQSDSRLAPPEHVVSISDYVERLRHDLATGGAEGGANQLKEITATLRPTLARLDAPVRTVLQVCALLGPEAIALPWLRALASQKHPELKEAADLRESDPWTRLVRTLIGMRLLATTPEPRVVTMHRVLHRVLERELRDERDDLQTQLSKHVESRAAELEGTILWKDARWELEPLGALAELWADTNHLRAAWLCNQAGRRWKHLANWTKAEQLLRHALAIGEASFGADHPQITGDLNALASLLLVTNQLGDAEALMRRALAIDEASFEANHLNIARDSGNLAQLLQVTSRLGEAEILMRRTLAISEASLGADHPDCAVCLNNLALLLQTTNRFAEAEPLIRRALAITEASLGADHPDVAIRLNNLALLLQATYRLGEAEPLMRRAVIILEKSIGENHPDVARLLNNLAHLLMTMNRLVEAEPLMRRVLAIDETSLGADHPEVAKDLNNLALLLETTNRFAEAEPLFHRAFCIIQEFQRSTGYAHSSQAPLRRNLRMHLVAKRMGKGLGIGCFATLFLALIVVIVWFLRRLLSL